jgi:hypothetical protein
MSKGAAWGSFLMVTKHPIWPSTFHPNQGKTISHVPYYVYNSPSSTCTWKKYLYAGKITKMDQYDG